MAIIKKSYLHGAGSDETHGGSQFPTPAVVFRDIADDLAGLNPGTPAWSGNLALTANVVTLTTAGAILSVYAQAGGTPGPKSLVPTGVPATGQAKVTYSVSGIPTITLAAGDSHTAIQVQQDKRPASFTVKTIKG